MENMISGAISIIGIIWFILNIILFFKIWEMCNDVKKILLHIEVAEEFDDTDKPICSKGNKKNNPSARDNKHFSQRKPSKSVENGQDLMMSFNEDCYKVFKKCKTREEFENIVDEIIEEYNKKDNYDYSTLKDGLWEQYKQL